MTERARLRAIQGAVVASWIAVFAVLMYMDAVQQQGRRTPSGCAAGFLTMLAHGIWITLDFRILGLRVGPWRFAAFFLGPLTIWLHLILRYRLQALWMIPASIGVYFIPMAAISIALAIKENWA